MAPGRAVPPSASPATIRSGRRAPATTSSSAPPRGTRSAARRPSDRTCARSGGSPETPPPPSARDSEKGRRVAIEYRLDTAQSILHVRPTSSLAREDFEELARAVDPHIEATG